MLTTASEAGVDLAGIMQQSGHASTSVARGYIRPAEQARNPAARQSWTRCGFGWYAAALGLRDLVPLRMIAELGAQIRSRMSESWFSCIVLVATACGAEPTPAGPPPPKPIVSSEVKLELEAERTRVREADAAADAARTAAAEAVHAKCIEHRRRVVGACAPGCADSRAFWKCLESCAKRDSDSDSSSVPYCGDPSVADWPSESACRSAKRERLQRCLPECEANPPLHGAAFDDCLKRCAYINFHDPIPMCSSPEMDSPEMDLPEMDLPETGSTSPRSSGTRSSPQCVRGKPCGNSCIARDKQCRH
jgi:hypothetical protein